MIRLASLTVSLGLLAAILTACGLKKVETANSSAKIVDESLSSLDLLREGTFSTIEVEYDSGPLDDIDVLPVTDREPVQTDIRGRLYLPQGQGPFPLVVFLHGNHGTCGLETGKGNPRLDVSVSFTTNGRCPNGFLEAPSYRGYDDSARLLASHGYIVASINANRGITGRDGEGSDGGLVYARGNLVLRHIEELYKWSRDGRNSNLTSDQDVDFKGKIDVSKVGLMGHSRGGEGVRYAYNIYNNSPSSSKWKARIPGLKFGGLFEIGPVDMGTDDGSRKIEAAGVAWNVLIPGCDNDVADFAGVNPYERMLANINDGLPKSVFVVWGANHNFFNSQWQVSDAPHACVGDQKPLWDTSTAPLVSDWLSQAPTARMGLTGSTKQIDMERGLLLAFFDANLGNGKANKLDHVFDPQYRLPRQISNLADTSRQYYVATDSRSVFDADGFVKTASSSGDVNITTLQQHVADSIKLQSAALAPYGYQAELDDNSLIRNAAVIEGAGSIHGKSVFLPLNQVTSGEGYWTLDIGLASRKPCFTLDKNFQPNCGPVALDNSFKVALVLEDGSLTKSVKIQDYVELENWSSDFFAETGAQKPKVYYEYIPVLYQTSRFELTDFGVRSQRIKGVQFTFDSGHEIALIVDSMRLTKK